MSSMRILFKTPVQLLVFICALGSTQINAQEIWPNRTIKFVVGFGPGGANDIVARVVADGVSKQLGQAVIVENKPGAGSVLGADLVAKSTPDGYTFFVSAGGIITNPMIKKTMPYKEGDLVPVAMLSVSPSVIVVSAESSVKSLKDLIVRAKASKGILFATAGTGSTPHFVAEMLKVHAGGQYEIVPYKSGSEAKVAVISNQVDATSEASVVVIPQIQGGRLRAIASTWNKRIEALPEVPTAKEEGYPEIFIGHWAGIFAPKGTPEPILDKMNKAIDLALRSPEIQKRLAPQGIEPIPGSRASFAKFLAEEKNRLQPIVRKASMKED
ncbi:MAG: tripartite tricarboxylate transporter substrate binding protein [Polynucleobacter sp.]|nr:tripartite tricarboxylate transporter substrate binding protein [Polynucleobacter sp.]